MLVNAKGEPRCPLGGSGSMGTEWSPGLPLQLPGPARPMRGLAQHRSPEDRLGLRWGPWGSPEPGAASCTENQQGHKDVNKPTGTVNFAFRFKSSIDEY